MIEEKKECDRCGTCCNNGGPALHDSDLELVRQGVISPVDLFTIRAGELIRDNINGGLFYTEAEIIKLAPRPASSRCRLYDHDGRACTMYEERPVQCRAMKCWNTSEIINLYGRDRMGRKDLFGHIPWLWEMIETHEAACRYSEIRTLSEQRAAGDNAAGRALSKMIDYDHGIRRVMIEKGGIESGMLAILFGRSLAQTIQHQFGIPVSSGTPGK